jgi:deazaflavin-dependent oxidoreductase (nitroreductase family)
MRVALVALGVVLGALAEGHADDEPLPEVSAALERIKGASTVELTTTGRKSGKDHSKPVWFVVENGKIIVQAGKDGKTDWYRNMAKTPTAIVRQGGYRFRVRAVMVDDPARIEAVHELFVGKYTTAWLLSFLGSSIGRGRPVELVPISVSVRR